VPNDEGGLKPEIKRGTKPIVRSNVAKKPKKAAPKARKPKPAPVVAEVVPANARRRRGRVQRVVDAIGETAELIVGSRDDDEDDDA
jgi:hypothetical protein